MRVVLWILALIGIIFILFISSIVIFGFQLAKDVKPLVEGAPVYAEESIRAYAENWDSQAILDRASPEMLQAINQNPMGLTSLSNGLKAVAGPLKTLATPVCVNADYTQTVDGQRAFSAACSTNGQTERADLAFNINVIHRADQWKLLGIFVNINPTEPADQTVQVNYNRASPSLNRSSAVPMTTETFFQDEPALKISSDGILFTTDKSQEIKTGAGFEFGN
ncbi:MAG: hypothetical protein AAF720_14735 [Pseudomonadota bacterium]